MSDYLTDMIFAQKYAMINRTTIASRICDNLGWGSVDAHNMIETVHNYINFSDFIIRKGAISSYEDETMIIPSNMEDGILVCQGKSNPEWNYSAPHGAGRALSRSSAKKKYDFKKTMAKISDRMLKKDIYSSLIPADEIKEAYKDPAIIEAAIKPTAEVINRIKPVLNLKA